MIPVGSSGQTVSEETIFINRPTRNKNCLRRPCLLKDQDKMRNLDRRPSIDDSCQAELKRTKEQKMRKQRSSSMNSLIIWGINLGAPTLIIWGINSGAPILIIWGINLGAPTIIIWGINSSVTTLIIWGINSGAPTLIIW